MNDNQRVSTLLRTAADLLEEQGANPFRVNAYRRAAGTIAGLAASVRELFDREGVTGLDALPGIGPGIAAAIAEILITERWTLLDRLRGNADPMASLQAVAGIGPELATGIHDALHVDTPEALEDACRDGRLATVPGIGARRAASISAAVTAVLDHRRRRRRGPGSEDAPKVPVELLLDVDREYRHKAQAGSLPAIAPKRFNPDGRQRLPILHTSRGAWHFTVLYSNTGRAHDLGRTRDWVVIYAYNDHHFEQQCTVVTETRGRLTGQRVVRGREAECATYWLGEHAAPAAAPVSAPASAHARANQSTAGNPRQ